MIVPPQPVTSNEDVREIERKMIDASERIAAIAPRAALARQVREYDSDRRKAALSKAVVGFLGNGESATAAEHKARASHQYAEAMRVLSSQYQSAEETLAEESAIRIQWETARSLLSMQKHLTSQL